MSGANIEVSSRKLFWAAVAVVVHAADVWGNLSPMVVSRKKYFVGSMNEAVETIPS